MTSDQPSKIFRLHRLPLQQIQVGELSEVIPEFQGPVAPRGAGCNRPIAGAENQLFSYGDAQCLDHDLESLFGRQPIFAERREQ